jgi:hypothetical protein
MTVTTRRRIIRFRKALKYATFYFWSYMKHTPEEDHPALAPFKKKYPCIDRNKHTCIEKFQLSTLERMYHIEKKIHELRCEVMMNQGYWAGRLTREQTYFLSIYKRELDWLKAQPKY